MKSRLSFSFLIAFMLSVSVSAVMAQEGDSVLVGSQATEDPMMDGAMMMDEMVATPTEVGNTICPVEGGKVGDMGEPAKVEHMGKMYNLCCPGCLAEFQKDPDKYSMMAQESMMKEEASDSSEAGTEAAY